MGKTTQKTNNSRNIPVPIISSHMLTFMKNLSMNISSKKHQKQHFQKYINKCRCCFTEFCENDEMIAISVLHREIFQSIVKVELKIDSNLSAYMCGQCDKNLKNLSEFAYTLRETTTNSNVASKCPRKKTISRVRVAQKKVEARKSLTISRKNTESTRNNLLIGNRPFSCDICGYRAKNKGGISQHIDLKHVIEKSRCELCLKIFNNPTRLKIHLKRHTVTKTYDCLICNYNFKNYTHLKRHVDSKHPFQKVSIECTCDVCGGKFYSKLKIDKHMERTHSGPIKCPIENCMKKFAYSILRKLHLISFHQLDAKVKKSNRTLISIFFINFSLKSK